jgi:hypothetical protein
MSAVDAVEKQPELQRVMGPGLLLLFVVGDILGTGVYALTGDVAAEIGGAAWLPFLIAFGVATITAFSYLELVTKYPQAAGAALYAHKAFGIHFITFLVAFVVCALESPRLQRLPGRSRRTSSRESTSTRRRSASHCWRWRSWRCSRPSTSAGWERASSSTSS